MSSKSAKTKIVLVWLGLLLVPASVHAHDTDSTSRPPHEWRTRLLVGGSVGGSLSGGMQIIDVLPMVGYVIRKTFIVGVGPRYSYHKSRHLVEGTRPGVAAAIDETHHHSFGIQVYGQAHWRLAIAHVEYGLINYSYRGMGMSATAREWVSTLALGGGLYIPLFPKRHGGIFVIGVYDVLQEKDISPYIDNFHVRFGMLVGLQ